MPEYFDISFIEKKTSSSKSEMECRLNQLGLTLGKHRSDLFNNRQIVVSFIEDDNADFEELYIGLPEQIFHEDKFENELNEITNFVNKCFELDPNIAYALCSYEINGYLLVGIKSLQEFNNDLLKRFPLVYIRQTPLKPPTLQINTEAQRIYCE